MKKHIALALTSTFIAPAANADSYYANEAFSPAQLIMIKSVFEQADRDC